MRVEIPGRRDLCVTEHLRHDLRANLALEKECGTASAGFRSYSKRLIGSEGTTGHFWNTLSSELKPSEYFKRQVFAPFWFEKGTAPDAINRIGGDSFLYETDFPHPTSMSPGPASIAEVPKDFVEDFFSQMSEETRTKILRDNAARIYHLDLS